MDVETKNMSVSELVAYRATILRNLEEVQHELDNLIRDEEFRNNTIYELETRVGKTQTDRNKYAHEIMRMQTILDDGT